MPVLPRDTAAMHRLWIDPDVRRFLWDDRVIGYDTAAAMTMASAADFSRRRFGIWSIQALDEGDGPIGFCGLRTGAISDEPELLFGLSPPFWGRGLALQAARAVLRHAFGTLGLPRIVAATDAPNERSARTLAALGMQRERRADEQGLVWFSLDAEAYRIDA